MPDKLKKFVQSNREKFDNHAPSNKLWEKIANAFNKELVPDKYSKTRK